MVLGITLKTNTDSNQSTDKPKTILRKGGAKPNGKPLQ